MEPKVSIELTMQQWNIVANYVAAGRFMDVADIIGEIKRQSDEAVERMNNAAQAVAAMAAAAAPAAPAPVVHPSQPANAPRAA